MSDYICKICNKKVEERKHFWTEHRIKEADYYQKYESKKDLYDNSTIIFKNNPESYFQTDFNSRPNLREYLKKVSKDEGINYLIGWLKRRKEIKGLVYAPDQFTTKSLLFPTISFIQKYYGKGTYEEICNKSELKIKFNYNNILEFESNKILNFIVDSRENSVLNVSNKQIKKLEYGDYSIENSQIFIEKKSLVDFCGTLSKGFDRFCRELDRCKKDNNYLIILVEEKFNNINSLKFLPHTKKVKATNEFILHQARQIIDNYPLTCQIVCADGKKNAVKFIEKVFSLKNNPQSLDYQYLIDTDKII